MPKRIRVISARRASRNVRRTARRIAYSDIFRVVARTAQGNATGGAAAAWYEPRRLIATRVDPSVLESFRKEACRRHVGYQTLINEDRSCRSFAVVQAE